jgi:hypothetical protein
MLSSMTDGQSLDGPGWPQRPRIFEKANTNDLIKNAHVDPPHAYPVSIIRMRRMLFPRTGKGLTLNVYDVTDDRCAVVVTHPL